MVNICRHMTVKTDGLFMCELGTQSRAVKHFILELGFISMGRHAVNGSCGKEKVKAAVSAPRPNATMCPLKLFFVFLPGAGFFPAGQAGMGKRKREQCLLV